LNKKPDTTFADSFRYLQKMVQDMGPAAGASYSLIAAILLLGGLGLLGDRYFNTEPVLMLIGIGIGMVDGLYDIAKVVFGKTD